MFLKSINDVTRDGWKVGPLTTMLNITDASCNLYFRKYKSDNIDYALDAAVSDKDQLRIRPVLTLSTIVQEAIINVKNTFLVFDVFIILL